MKPSTRTNHPPRVTLPAGNRALVEPIYQSVKYEFETVAATERMLRGEADGYYYSRRGNPNTRALELLLAEMQGRDECVVVGSGIAAVAVALLGLLAAGDHVLCFVETYGPTRSLIRRTLARFGVTHTLLSIEDDAGIERVLAERPTRLVWFESPTNPMLKLTDVGRLVALAHRHGALAVMDNTFGGLHAHAASEVDVFVHSLTKYAAGHGDVLAGAVIARAELARRVRAEVLALGPTLDPHAAFLVQRGLKTYHVRRRAECDGAAQVAHYLADHPRVSRVHYPGLPADPGHALARAQLGDFGSIVTCELAGGAAEANTVAESLELFGLAASLGSTESLVLPGQLLDSPDFTPEQRRLSGIKPSTVRLSIGLEDPEDLVADLAQALARAFPA